MKVIARSSIKPKIKSKERPAFDAQAFLDSAGVARKVTEFKKKAAIFSQGDPAKSVLYSSRRRGTAFGSE